MITIAIAKGRMQDSALSLLARAGIRAGEEAVNSRRLALTDETGQYRFIFVKPADVPVYVEHGIADCGVVGRDVLLESEADLLLPLDLGIARCRIVVAAADPEAVTDVRGIVWSGKMFPNTDNARLGAAGMAVEIFLFWGRVGRARALAHPNPK